MNTNKSYLIKKEPDIYWIPTMTCYLAGSMEYSEDEGLSWRLEYKDYLYNKYFVDCIIPNEVESLIKNQKDLNKLKKKDPLKYEEIMRQFIKLDLNTIKNCSFVITKWEGERISGTVGEAQFAYLNGIPNYLITSKEYWEIPGWFAACFTHIFSSLEDLILYFETRECKCKKLKGNIQC